VRFISAKETKSQFIFFGRWVNHVVLFFSTRFLNNIPKPSYSVLMLLERRPNFLVIVVHLDRKEEELFAEFLLFVLDVIL
jgi:hypothetical protein